MARELRAYVYRPGNSVLHRAPGSLKLAGLFLISGAAFFPGFSPKISAALAVIILSLWAGIPPRELLRGSGSLFFTLLIIILVRALNFHPPGLNYPGLREGFLFASGIAVSFSAGALLFSLATMTEIKDSLSKLEETLRRPIVFFLKKIKKKRTEDIIRRLERNRLSLGISLMLGFLPRFFEIWEAANLAWEARAGGKKISRVIVLVPLVTERMIELAAETAEALESRGGAW
jgi:biotin transport system permease protein